MKFKVLILVCAVLVCTSCLNTSPKIKLVARVNKDSIFNIYNLDTLRFLLNKDTSEIKKLYFQKDVTLKDSTFESDEGLNWGGFVFSKGSQILAVAETSWENKKVVKRITVLSSNIEGSIHLKVGAKFKDIKSYLSETIPSFPDGYFGLRDKNTGQFTCFFDIDDNHDLSIGNIKFETIPDSLKVSQILIE